MKKIRALVLTACAITLAAPSGGMAMPLTQATALVQAQSGARDMLDQIQYRRYYAPRPVRGPIRRHRGGAGAAAAVVGLGVLGAIAAGSAAAGPAECWYERRRLVDDWGRVIGVRRVRVCR